LPFEVSAGFCHPKRAIIINVELAHRPDGVSSRPLGYSATNPDTEAVHFHSSGKTSFKNIKVEGSVVGSINTGEIERIDLALNNVRAGGEIALAGELQKLIQAVVDSKELALETRNETVDTLSYLATQAVLPKELRQKSLGQRMISNLERLFEDSANLTTIFVAAALILHKLFS
jgi:hypothetical protein